MKKHPGVDSAMARQENEAPLRRRTMDLPSIRVVVGLCVLKALVHLVLVNRYGYHGDELYFLECGEEHAATIDRVYQSLPVHERNRASVLAGTYSQASAVNVLRTPTTPRAVSGNMNYHLWGPDGARGDVLIAYGLPREFLERQYGTCSESARIEAPLARPWDTDLPVYVCRDARGTMAALWPEVRRFGHTPTGRQGRSEGSEGDRTR